MKRIIFDFLYQLVFVKHLEKEHDENITQPVKGLMLLQEERAGVEIKVPQREADLARVALDRMLAVS